MNKYLAELIGIEIGDGFLDNAQKHYRIGIAGDPINDREYFDYVKTIIKKQWMKDAKIVERQRAIYIRINSKSAFLELTQKYQLPIGEGKCEKVVIPEIIAKDWSLAKHAIRGIVDTDGSIFVADKPRSLNYPSIEITTCSLILATQLKKILSEHGFRVANIWRYQSKKKNTRPSFKVPLNGYENVYKWLRLIGFSNPVKRKKAENVILLHNF